MTLELIKRIESMKKASQNSKTTNEFSKAENEGYQRACRQILSLIEKLDQE